MYVIKRLTNETAINIGRQGENIATVIEFPLDEYIENYGAGTAQLVHIRPGDTAPYLCTTEQLDTALDWMITNEDTAYAGTGMCELRWVVDDTLAKSMVYRTSIAPSITADSVIPDPYQSWYDAMMESIASALSRIDGIAVDAAANSRARLGVLDLNDLNIDELHSDDSCGIYILDCSSSTEIAGRFPETSGYGLFIIKKITDDQYIQFYLPVSANGTSAPTRARFRMLTLEEDSWHITKWDSKNYLENSKRGSYGINYLNMTEITDDGNMDYDINNYTDPGSYFVDQHAAPEMLNSPVTDRGFSLHVEHFEGSRLIFGNGGGYVLQAIYARSATKSEVDHYTRHIIWDGDVASWSPWVKTATQSDIAALEARIAALENA